MEMNRIVVSLLQKFFVLYLGSESFCGKDCQPVLVGGYIRLVFFFACSILSYFFSTLKIPDEKPVLHF